MNKFQFIGRITREVELVTTSTTVLAKFTVAVDRKFAGKDKEKISDFFNLIAFGKTGEYVNNYATKGSLVFVEGRIQNKTWEDKDGNKRYATDFITDTVQLLGGRKENNTNNVIESESTGLVEGTDYVTIEDTDELPF